MDGGNHSRGHRAGDGGVGVSGKRLPKYASGFRDFIERGNSFLEVATRVGDRLAEAAENRGTWYETLLSS